MSRPGILYGHRLRVPGGLHTGVRAAAAGERGSPVRPGPAPQRASPPVAAARAAAAYGAAPSCSPAAAGAPDRGLPTPGRCNRRRRLPGGVPPQQVGLLPQGRELRGPGNPLRPQSPPQPTEPEGVGPGYLADRLGAECRRSARLPEEGPAAPEASAGFGVLGAAGTSVRLRSSASGVSARLQADQRRLANAGRSGRAWAGYLASKRSDHCPSCVSSALQARDRASLRHRRP